MRSRCSHLTLLLLAAVTFLAACSVGEYGPEQQQQQMMPDAAMQTNPANETSFNNTVKPLVMTCIGCHGGNQPPNLTSFTALEAKYKMKPGSTNILTTKGNHVGITYFDATGKAAVQGWIDGLQ